MTTKNKEISNLIAREFDTRMEASVFSYILDTGIQKLKEVTEDGIKEVEGNGFMTAEFIQALVRTAVLICKEYTPMEIMEYIRVGCSFSPFTKELTLYRDDYRSDTWEEICCDLNKDSDTTEITITTIIEEED